MSKQTQKEAVFSAVMSVFNEANISVTDGEDASQHLTRELRAQVVSILVEGFNSDSIALDKQFANSSELKNYCSGLLSNWLRKDTRLNGGVKYVAKNPGSRTGSSDAQIKAMRILLSTKTDPIERAEIQAFVDRRLTEISSVRKPTKTINVEDLPPELQHLVK